MVKQALRRHPQRRPLVGLMLTEVMLVGGLFIMVFGSIANLTLGKNGYTVGFASNNTGVVVLVAAALFLVVVRGAAKMLARGRTGHLGVGGGLAANLALAVGVIVFFGGERSRGTVSPQSARLVVVTGSCSGGWWSLKGGQLQ